MCGLALCISKRKKHTGQRVLDLYKKQEHRGKQGFGILSIKNGKLLPVFRAKYEFAAKAHLVKDNADIILFHHRFPTSTKNVLGATHPIFVSHPELEYDYYIQHNGVINNHHTLKIEHNKLGYVYTTEFKEVTFAEYKDGTREEMDTKIAVFNDSESLAIEIARWLEDKKESIGARGAAAFQGIAMYKGTDKVHSLFFGKNKGRDLCVQDTSKWYIISSETGDDIEDMKLWRMNIETEEWTEQPLVMDEAAPPAVIPPVNNVYGFGARSRQDEIDWGDSFRTGGRDWPSDPAIKGNIEKYEHLMNAYYTTIERDETGVPPSEFYQVSVGATKLWVPMKFQAATMPRVMFSEAYKDTIKYKFSQVDHKTMSRLEDLAMDYAEKQNEYEDIEKSVSLTIQEDESYKAILEGIELKLLEIEESISALNVDQEIVDEVLDTAQSLVGYEKSIPSPYAFID